jgi:hypothetical protein
VTRGRWLGMLVPVKPPLLVRFFALVLCATTGGCSGGTETGNPPFRAELSYTAYSSMPLRVGVREPSSQTVVDSAWLDLDAVALIGAGRCGQAEARPVSVPALGVGDHASGQHNSTVFALAASEYCALELPFVLAQQSELGKDAPPDLARHSIMLAGALADGTQFTLLSAATPRVRLNADSGSFEISAAAPRTLIAFDVAEWLADLDWATATRVNGAIRISPDENPALLAQFEANLPRGVALYRDENGDGKLDELPVRLAHGE